MKHRIALISAVLIASLLSFGCSTISERPAIAQLAVQYGVVKFLEKNPSHAPRVVEIATALEENAGSTSTVTIALLEEALRAQINWSKLDAADTVLVNGLIAAVREELIARVGIGELTPEQALVVKQVAGWIKSAALMSQPS